MDSSSLQITFRHMDPSTAIEARVREHAQRLERFYDRITSCRVVIEAPHRHHNKGNLYHVGIELIVPDEKLVISRDREQHHAHEDPYVAIRDAFDAMRRRLESYAMRRRRDVKTHDVPPHGRVVRLEAARDFGLIQTPDGREIYFHRNSVVGGDFDKLQVGTEVRFVEDLGDQGPRATTVHVVGKHHVVG
jgi:ribosome-associated translation inhibitor RaiA